MEGSDGNVLSGPNGLDEDKPSFGQEKDVFMNLGFDWTNFSNVYDEDDEDDEFNPENMDAEEEDEDESAPDGQLDDLGIARRTRKRHKITDDLYQAEIGEDVYLWELSMPEEQYRYYLGPYDQYGYHKFLINTEQQRDINLTLARHFQLLVQTFLLSKKDPSMYSVTLGSWHLLVELISKLSEPSAAFFIEGTQLLEQLQPLIQQRDPLDARVIHSYLNLFKNHFFPDLANQG